MSSLRASSGAIDTMQTIPAHTAEQDTSIEAVTARVLEMTSAFLSLRFELQKAGHTPDEIISALQSALVGAQLGTITFQHGWVSDEQAESLVSLYAQSVREGCRALAKPPLN